ncbi:ribonuclease HII [Candidatus Protochlamydia sp. R18]|uniref:ribonuclease HII n=1 Tax=Candidatus Protochlamydia sp. R18 TaxID=1353977 RepID=UPI0005A6F5E5|nr:ribonuclease HII [Candidatus Protochlamydia sp. R18]
MPDLISTEELTRLEHMSVYEKRAFSQGYQLIAGIDEAGRGPLAGPVVAAACILPKGLLVPQINDSKKLSPKVRERLFERLTTDSAVRYGIGIIGQAEIDRVNIYQATILAMLMAIQQLPVTPDYVLVDGMNLPHPDLPCLKIIKGDQLSQSIAAASIIAKETRDRLMCQYHREWPGYGFNQHKGYATELHLEALFKQGPCPIHRRSFDPIKSMLEVEIADDF